MGDLAVGVEALKAALGDREYRRLCGYWRTPLELYNVNAMEFGFTLDAAASAENSLCTYFLDEEYDALSNDWICRGAPDVAVRAWCNPPHGDLYPWMKQAYEQTRLGIVEVAVVVGLASTSSRWWEEYAMRSDEIRDLTPRVPFVPPPEFLELGYAPGGNDGERVEIIFRRERRNGGRPLRWTWKWNEDI